MAKTNLLDISEMWKDEDLNLLINMQTPIYKKKSDLLFQEVPQDSLSVSPLVPIKALKKVSNHQTKISKSNNVENMKPYAALSQTDSKGKLTGAKHDDDKENRKVHTERTGQRIKGEKREPLKAIQEVPTNKTLKTAYSQQEPLYITNKPTTERSSEPSIHQGKKVSFLETKTVIQSSSDLVTNPKGSSLAPPPLPELPPHQLIVKLFEEKQKRFWNKFEMDSEDLIHYIKTYTID